jgi:hypothetical protein
MDLYLDAYRSHIQQLGSSSLAVPCLSRQPLVFEQGLPELTFSYVKLLRSGITPDI